MLYLSTHCIQASIQTHQTILGQIFLNLHQSVSQGNEVREVGKAHSPSTFFSPAL